MRVPDGQEMPNRGVYLEVIPNRKLVLTDAYTAGLDDPSAGHPFMTVIVTFEDSGEPARHATPPPIRHWTVADRERHEQMGFHTPALRACAPTSWPRWPGPGEGTRI